MLIYKLLLSTHWSMAMARTIKVHDWLPLLQQQRRIKSFRSTFNLRSRRIRFLALSLSQCALFCSSVCLRSLWFMAGKCWCRVENTFQQKIRDPVAPGVNLDFLRCEKRVALTSRDEKSHPDCREQRAWARKIPPLHSSAILPCADLEIYLWGV